MRNTAPLRERQVLDLNEAVQHLLEECRMVLPGIQALFGFQLIAVFSEGFMRELSAQERHWHLAALVAVALSAALVMAPAAFHRHRGALQVDRWLIDLSTRLLMWSMAPLAVGLCIDIGLVAGILLPRAWSNALAASLFVVYLLLWFVLPRLTRRRLDRRTVH